MKKLLITLIEIYQVYFSFDKGVLALLAPGGSCRYEISCSEYTKQAVIQDGVTKGLILGIKRIWSCK
jgi:putative component of membrane protein insertase Oxa1/YidC/SpoIIIJ protein YidD